MPYSFLSSSVFKQQIGRFIIIFSFRMIKQSKRYWVLSAISSFLNLKAVTLESEEMAGAVVGVSFTSEETESQEYSYNSKGQANSRWTWTEPTSPGSQSRSLPGCQFASLEENKTKLPLQTAAHKPMDGRHFSPAFPSCGEASTPSALPIMRLRVKLVKKVESYFSFAVGFPIVSSHLQKMLHAHVHLC